MHTPDRSTQFTISRDGETLATVIGEFELMRYFRYHPYSLHHAVAYEGYRIQDPSGQDVEV